jgi:glycosyltransferase involved in cell wall biosynthesis
MWLTGRAMSRAALDVLLFPTIYSFVPTLTRARKIVVVHDTIAETFPQLTLPNPRARLFWQAKVRIGRAQANALVTVSEYSRRMIVSRFGIAPERVFVVGEAADPVFRRISGARPPRGVPADKRLIVYVGGFSPHKNLEALVAAFARLAGREVFGDVVLVLVGEYKKEIFHSYFGTISARVAELGLRERVVFTGYMPDEELAQLLNVATVLALPSLMEGFGLPAVEAAACGCPVVATTESPLPELLADGGIFCDPRGGGLEAALETILGDRRLRDSMAETALASAQRLTWDAAASQMLDVIGKVAPG